MAIGTGDESEHRRELDGERIDVPTLLILAIERSNDLLLARFNRTPKEG